MDPTINQLIKEFTPPFHNSVLIFTVILVIILLSPLVLRRVRIPGIIVLIISGIFIGPQGFHLIERDNAVALFSTIGLLYIMFLAGLELEPDEFIKNKNKSILFGTLTFFLPLVIGFPVCHFILGYNFLTSLLTASMFSTHTLIAYPIVSKMDLTKNEAVAITVGGTIITDTAVLVILALINGIQSGNTDWFMWINLAVKFLLFFLFMFKLVPVVSKWVLKKVENERYSHYIFVLATVFFSAFIAELAGLEPIIGAFMAGLVLNRLIPKTSPLMNRIEFAGNALFIPFFLISIGMIIDLNAIVSGPQAIWTAIILAAVAFLGKWLAAVYSSRLLNYSALQRNLIFGLSSSHAVATLAVITVGYEMGILDSNILNGTIILILISCIASSLITEHAARNLALQQETNYYHPREIQPDKILVTISNPSTMTFLTDLALNISASKRKPPVNVLSVVQDNQQAKEKLAETRAILNKLIKHAAETEREIQIITTLDQNVANGIRRIITETSSTDIIMGTSPQSKFADVIFGNLMQHLMHSTRQMLYFYKPQQPVYAYTSLQVICPPHSDKEYGFKNWLGKVTQLSKNLGVPCCIYSDKETVDAITQAALRMETSGNFDFQPMDIYKELIPISNGFSMTDLIIFIQPREGSVSYDTDYKTLITKVDEEKANNPYLIISPNQHDDILY